MPFFLHTNPDIGLWKETPVKSLPLPAVSVQPGSIWSLSTQGNAGGYAWRLPKPVVWSAVERVSWRWKAQRHPDPRNTGLIGLFKPLADDAAVRVGFVFDSGASNLPLPEAWKTETDRDNISHVIFHNLVSQHHKPSCSSSPLTRHITYRNVPHAESTRFALHQETPESISTCLPAAEALSETSRLIGIWVFADSDDSRSQSKAALQLPQIKLSSP